VSRPYQAILLAAFGGPTRPEEIRPFLARVTKGISIAPERLEEVAHHYEAVGGKSPLTEITFRQGESLQNLLRARGVPLPVYVGLRNSSPFFAETLKRMAEDGVKRALGFILSSHRSEASWERYQKNIADAGAELAGNAPEMDYCDGWHDHPLFIQTWAELIETALSAVAPGRRSTAPPLIFTAHSLPVAMAERSPYVEQLNSSATMIADRLRCDDWSLAYQSRSGRPGELWLEPDIGEALRSVAARGATEAVVAPIGFVCDHVEVLYDLDIEAKEIAKNAKLKMLRASCPNNHPAFIRMIADVIEQQIKRGRG
jgi:ferrochelatase